MSAIVLHHPQARAHTARPEPEPGLFGQLWATITAWHDRARTRARLAELDEHMLRDIGLDPAVVDYEIRKPFWRG